ncbi:MAG: beta-lactamase family protein, partial [Actinobacteria bacterium]|nr:beta-lactamase family protein [Actinomycetota bacterium]
MYRLDAVGEWLHDELPRLLGRHGVPGAAVAVSRGDDVVDVAAGVLNRATGVTATTDSLFQIGSITKVWTATLAMQLVDEGALDLDAPVRRYLPDFALADEDAAARITVRQLMCHVAGFEGDVFTDTGKGDDRVARYVRRLRDVPQLCPPGA